MKYRISVAVFLLKVYIKLIDNGNIDYMYFIGLLQDRDGNSRPLLQTWIDLNSSLYK